MLTRALDKFYPVNPDIDRANSCIKKMTALQYQLDPRSVLAAGDVAFEDETPQGHFTIGGRVVKKDGLSDGFMLMSAVREAVGKKYNVYPMMLVNGWDKHAANELWEFQGKYEAAEIAQPRTIWGGDWTTHIEDYVSDDAGSTSDTGDEFNLDTVVAGVENAEAKLQRAIDAHYADIIVPITSVGVFKSDPLYKEFYPKKCGGCTFSQRAHFHALHGNYGAFIRINGEKVELAPRELATPLPHLEPVAKVRLRAGLSDVANNLAIIQAPPELRSVQGGSGPLPTPPTGGGCIFNTADDFLNSLQTRFPSYNEFRQTMRLKENVEWQKLNCPSKSSKNSLTTTLNIRFNHWYKTFEGTRLVDTVKHFRAEASTTIDPPRVLGWFLARLVAGDSKITEVKGTLRKTL